MNVGLMRSNERGFTLVELIAIMILIGIVSVTLFSRMSAVNTAAIQGGRDDIIAALFFAQQIAMARNNIQLTVGPTSVSVIENGTPIAVTDSYYPLSMPAGITLSSTQGTLSYDKLGRTTPATITITGSGNTAGSSATISVTATGYAYAN